MYAIRSYYGELKNGSTWHAQGGIAAVLAKEDSIDAHVADTIVAGAELSRPDAVDHTVRESRSSIDWLIEQGVPFTRESGHYHLTKEGGHSRRRIIHAADATGRAVEQTVITSYSIHYTKLYEQ